jgi:hypothetical protein
MAGTGSRRCSSGTDEKADHPPLLSEQVKHGSRSDSAEFEEMCLLNALRKVSAEPVDLSSPKHLETLKSLWESAFPYAGPTRCPSDVWTQLGFQGRDPVEELRAHGGYVALTHLLNVVKAEEKQKLVRPALPMLAAASMDVTAMLQSYFGLSEKVTLPAGCRHEPCPREVRSAFLSVHARDERTLGSMHLALVRHLARVWLDMQARVSAAARTPLPVARFPAALRTTHHHMQTVLSNAPRPWNTREVLKELTWGDTVVELADDHGQGMGALAWRLLELVHRQLGCSKGCGVATPVGKGQGEEHW